MKPGNTTAYIGFATYAMMFYDTVATVCSSPQTAEINAKTRAPTLMKWVKLGILQGVVFTIVGMVIAQTDGEAIWPPALGGGMAGILIWTQYQHALKAGLASDEPETESW